MRRFGIPAVIILTFLLTIATPGFAGKHSRSFNIFDGQLYTSDDINIDIDDGSVFITHADKKGEIEITEDYELYIDGDLIETDDHQKELLREYHTLVFDIKKSALDVGKEGARIGIEGAKLGLKAIGGVIKLIFTDYDEDDLDRDMDREAELLEFKAEELEDMAEDIEEMADELDDLFYDMEDEIPAIANLDW